MQAEEYNAELQAMRENIHNREQALKLMLKKRKWSRFLNLRRLEIDNNIFSLRAEIDAKKEYLKTLTNELKQLKSE